MFAKILFALSVGLLFGHQFVAHHHHDDFEVAVSIHGDHDDAHDHLPPHHIAHVFSADQAKTGISKETNDAVYLPALFDYIFAPPAPLPVKREYIDIRPPLIKGYNYFSLRAPPAA